MNGRQWTKKEIAYLKRNYSKYDIEHVARKLGRPYNSVLSKAMRLGLNTGKFKRWQKWEENYLKRHYDDRKKASISKTLKRTLASVHIHAQKLKLTSKPNRRWTKNEKDYLKLHYADRSIPLKKIAENLNRSVNSIYSYAKILNLTRPSNGHKWTQEEHSYLAANYKVKRFKDIAADLDLSNGVVIFYSKRHGMYRKAPTRYWTEKEMDYVRQYYAIKTAEEIGNTLGRTVRSVNGCARRLGLQSKHNWYKPANIEARVRKFKIWKSKNTK